MGGHVAEEPCIVVVLLNRFREFAIVRLPVLGVLRNIVKTIETISSQDRQT